MEFGLENYQLADFENYVKNRDEILTILSHLCVKIYMIELRTYHKKKQKR